MAENINTQMRKGMLEYCILLIISKKHAYASDIILALKEAKMIVVEGTLYPLLTRLKNSGMLTYEWQESTQGPPRKYYALTETGQQLLTELDAAWSDITEIINTLKHNQE